MRSLEQKVISQALKDGEGLFETESVLEHSSFAYALDQTAGCTQSSYHPGTGSYSQYRGQPDSFAS